MTGAHSRQRRGRCKASESPRTRTARDAELAGARPSTPKPQQAAAKKPCCFDERVRLYEMTLELARAWKAHSRRCKGDPEPPAGVTPANDSQDETLDALIEHDMVLLLDELAEIVGPLLRKKRR